MPISITVVLVRGSRNSRIWAAEETLEETFSSVVDWVVVREEERGVEEVLGAGVAVCLGRW